MLHLSLFVVLVGLLDSSLGLDKELDDAWVNFKQVYSKDYTQDIELLRRLIWEENVRTIQRHNLEADRGVHAFHMGENEYSDMGQCGSCWAFSATGALEGQNFKKTGKLVSLSEQNLVDCSKKQGNQGCQGGLPSNAFTYIKDNKGVDTEDSYPYKAKNGKCKFASTNIGATDKGYKTVFKGFEYELQKAVAEIGPISIGMDASHGSFQQYKSGIYSEKLCSRSRLDHGVLVVGYGSQNGEDYWIVKNR